MSSILDQLSALGGGPPQGGAPQQDMPTPGDQQDTSGDSSAQQSAVDLIKSMLDAANQYLQVEPDEEDKLVVSKILPTLQQLLAKDQQEADGALQGKVSPRLIRKSMSDAGGGQAGGGVSGGGY